MEIYRWTEEEIKILIELIKKGYDYKTIQRKLTTKTVGAIKAKLYSIYNTGDLDKIKKDIDKIQKFEVSSNKRWTEEEKQILEDMTWEGYSTKEIQQYLPNRSMAAIRKQKTRM